MHLVGHSYGGALALHIALRRSERIAGVTLFEPCTSHVLPQLGAAGREASAETGRLAASIERQIAAGEPRYAERRRSFVLLVPASRYAVGFLPTRHGDMATLTIGRLVEDDRERSCRAVPEATTASLDVEGRALPGEPLLIERLPPQARALFPPDEAGASARAMSRR